MFCVFFNVILLNLYAKYLFPESNILDYVKNDSRLIELFEKEIFADLKQIRKINYYIEKREIYFQLPFM